MSKELRITLRPPPHRDYLTGYPGIPSSPPSTNPPPPPDPLQPLPFIPRPQAHLSGTVEVRSPASSGKGAEGGGGGVRAKWLSVELEKIETVPPMPLSSSGGGEEGKKGNKKAGGADGKQEGRFVELIGTGPNKLWEAGSTSSSSGTALKVERTKSPNTAAAAGVVSPKKKGLLGRIKIGGKGRAAAADDDDEDGDAEGEEDGYEVLPDGNYPFSIPIPEGLPPTIEVDNKGDGVAYQIVATLCSKPKKSLLKSSSSLRPLLNSTSASILLDKADLLPWPHYFPLLPLPLPPSLPWAASPDSGEPTVGETKENKLALEAKEELGRGSGEVWVKATRRGAAFGPGDAVEVFVQIGWGGEGAIKLTRLDFTLRETLTYRYPSPSNASYMIRAPPKVTSLFTANASVSPDPEKDPEAFAVLYKGEPVGVEMVGVVPSGHARVTVRTAKHVDIAYHLKVRAMLEGGSEVAIDNWPVVLGSVSARVAKGIMHEIGWVEGLCERPGVGGGNVSALSPSSPPGEPTSLSQPSSRAAPRNFAAPAVVAPPPVVPAASPAQRRHQYRQPPPAPSPHRAYLDSQNEKAQLLAGRSSSFQHISSSNGSHSASGGGYHIANPSVPSPSTATSPLPAPSPVRPAYAPPLTAEEEKRQYYDSATRSRDALQTQAGLLRTSIGSGVAAPSPTVTTRTAGTVTDEEDGASLRSPASAEEEKVALHQAAVLRRSMIQTGLQRQQQKQVYPSAADEKQRLIQQMQQPPNSPPRIQATVEDTPLVARAHFVTGSTAAPTRSNTIMAFSGSEVSVSPPSLPPTSPPDSHLLSPLNSSVSSATTATGATSFLGRSLTTAEAEKRRLFLDAKETARRRQEEARLELERQNRVLAEMEFEEAQNAYEERLIAEAEAEKRIEERRVREQFEREQRERIREEEERWAREEEERRRKAEQEREERRARAEQAMKDELRRFEEQQRQAEQDREDEIARQIAERKAEDEMKRRKAEEFRRQDEEREREENERRLAASRKAEFERQRAEDERHRQEAEEARRLEVERRQREEDEARARTEAEAQARARWEAEERARLQREREEEEERRRAHEVDLARLAAEAARRREENEARIRAEQEAASAAAAAAAATPPQINASTPAYSYNSNGAYNHPAYPSANGRSAALPEHVQVQRAPSVASFAPSMSAAAADADFYARSIAQSSGLSSEKAAYLRQLRARDEERRGGNASGGSTPSTNSLNRRPSQSQPPTNVYNADPAMQQNLYSGFHSQPAYPQLPQPPQPPSRSDSYTPVASVVGRYAAPSEAPAVPPLPPQPAPASSSSSSTSTYKTAAQEKEEAAARRRAEDARGKQPAIPEDEELPPSYGVPGSATSPRTTAAEEKAELERYYAAKAAVDAQQARQAPPPAPVRASTAASTTFDHYMAGTPVPSYQPGQGPTFPESFSSPAYPSTGPATHPPAPPQNEQSQRYTPQRSDSIDSHKNGDAYRDPSIAAGKRPVVRQASGSFGSGGEYASSLLSPSQSTAGYVYPAPPPVEPLRTISAAARQDAREALGNVDYGSFHLDDSFPEFEVLSNQISRANEARFASQNGSTM